MDEFVVLLNDLLVKTFRNILKFEEKSINYKNKMMISISEVHLIEAVAQSANKTISEIANELGITLSSVTVAVNKLVKKGFLAKDKSDIDGRSVIISLTRQGEKAKKLHGFFHQKMVREMSDQLSEEERTVLLRGIKKLNDFFEQSGLEA